jgi:hypothetical protein
VSRCTAVALIALLGIAVSAPPAMADPPSTPQKSSLTTLSAASVKVLRTDATTAARAQQSGASDSFLGSTKGKVAVGLMVVGAGIALWSIQHDRKPVKSPIR